jgi:hypothetical protein
LLRLKSAVGCQSNRRAEPSKKCADLKRLLK